MNNIENIERRCSMVSNTLLQQLVDEFCKPRPEFDGKNYITRRREWFDRPMQLIKPLLQKDKLAVLTPGEAQRIYKEMTVGGPQLYPKSFIDNGIERIRVSLHYLLYGEDSLDLRFFNVVGNVESEYRLNGVGRAFASTALLLLNPNEFGVWNGAIDGGLRKLGLFPGKKRGEHLGQMYVRILGILKQLRDKCEFPDLSVTDEFVELIYHGRIGENILKEPPLPEEEAPSEPSLTDKEDTHLKLQWMLAKIGKWEGYDVWVAVNDYGKEFSGEKMSAFCLAELPHFAGPEVLKIAKLIDVIWFKQRSSQPVRFFEIEHTTPIFSGLLRFNDVKIDYPIPRATIVAAKEKRGLFEIQISRRTFVHSELEAICDLMDYRDVERLFESEKVRAGML